jgi:hypothetical protein
MRRILIAALASSLLTGAVIAATGIAGSTKKAQSGPPPTMAQALKDHQAQRDQHLANVAKRLSVSPADLTAAIDKVRSAQLEQAVKDGKLTAAERDAILACKQAPLTCDRSNLPAFVHHGIERGEPKGERRGHPPAGRPPREMSARRDAFFAALAKELGKNATDVRKAFEAERPAMDGPRGPHGPGGPEGPGPEGPPGPGPGFGGP